MRAINGKRLGGWPKRHLTELSGRAPRAVARVVGLCALTLTIGILGARVVSGGDLIPRLENELRRAGISTRSEDLVKAVTTAEKALQRQQSALLLGLRNETAYTKQLQEAARSERDWLARHGILEALLIFRDEWARSECVRLMNLETETRDKLSLARLLASHHDPSGYSVVLEALQAETVLDRAEAVSALQSFVRREHSASLDPDPVTLLIGAAGDDPSAAVRKAAVRVLGSLLSQGHEHPRALERLVKSADSDLAIDVRTAAREEIDRLAWLKEVDRRFSEPPEQRP